MTGISPSQPTTEPALDPSDAVYYEGYEQARSDLSQSLHPAQAAPEPERLRQVLGAFYKTADMMKSARNSEAKTMNVWADDMKAVEDVMLFLEQLRDSKSSDGGAIGAGVPAQMQGSNDRGLAHDDVKPEDTTQGDRPARPVTCPPSDAPRTFDPAQPPSPDAVKMYADALDAANKRIAELEARAWQGAQPPVTPYDNAAFKDTDDAEIVTILAAVRHCANSWDGSARLVGNVRARDISRACTASINALQLTQGDKGEAVAWQVLSAGKWYVPDLRGPPTAEELRNEPGRWRPLYAAPQPASNANYEKAIALLDWSTWYLTPASQRNWEERVEQFLADPSRPVDIPLRPTTAAYDAQERIAELQYEAGMYKSLYEVAVASCAEWKERCAALSPLPSKDGATP